MRNIQRASWIGFLASMLFVQSSFGMKTYEFESEKDLPLKQSLPIYIQHKLGSVTIQGWVQDRIRATLKMKVIAETDAEAEAQFKKLDLVTLETRQQFELRVGQTHGVDLVTKMRNAANNNVSVDLEIRAPYLSDLTLLLGKEKTLTLTDWRGAVNISGIESPLVLNKLHLNRPLQINCADCELKLTDSKCTGNINIGAKTAFLTRVEATPTLSIEETNEEVKLVHTRGLFQVFTKSGRLNASTHQGQIQFRSEEGGVFISNLNGPASIQTKSGQVMIDQDNAQSSMQIDTDRGDVQISLPSTYEGELDLMSLKGDVVVQFPYEIKKIIGGGDVYGPASPGRVDAIVGSSTGSMIHAYSKQGGVRLLRKSRNK